MSIAVALLIILIADAIAVAAMLAVRKRSPRGHFKDSQLAAGVFTVLGTAFAVLLAFVFLLAFQSYLKARDSAEAEAGAINSLYALSEQLDGADGTLAPDVVCYARAVVDEWPRMRDQGESPRVNATVETLHETFEMIRVRGPEQTNAHDHWLTADSARNTARRGRLVEASPFVPPLVWVVLCLAGLIVIVFTGFFADRRERVATQILMMASVTTIVVASLLVVRFLDRPYDDHPGSITPKAMEAALNAIDRDRADEGAKPVRCGI